MSKTPLASALVRRTATTRIARAVALTLALQACGVALSPSPDADEGADAADRGDARERRDGRAPREDAASNEPDVTSTDAGSADVATADVATNADVATAEASTDEGVAVDASIVDASVSDVALRDAAPDGGSMLGRVIPEAGACRPGGGTPVPGTTCSLLRVECPGVEPAQVALRVSPPPAGTPSRGIIVFGSGTAGTGFYSGDEDVNAMFMHLHEAGYTLLERAWTPSGGWLENSTGAGMVASACRYGTLLRYIDATYRTGTQPFCATGNSGGSVELGYALLRQGAGAVLDLAVPSSGPFHRLDLACQGDRDASWPAECQRLKRTHCPSCMNDVCIVQGPRRLVDTSYATRTPCTGTSTPVELGVLRPDSPTLEGMAPSLPNTRVVLLIGEQDHGGYAPLSAALFETLRAAGTDVAFETEPGAGHDFQNYPEGAQHLERVLLRDCRRRH